eukprot:TRINITY_DN23223_c0_g1_i1.p1 TRINITY_DN23223_c0_g1~~TRINITY_DN23223_c0_g1_i1.p1  ORF type:complete len:686 (-),score=124.61 TRINITY_DN23223_c0_g1_i1:118-2175(-)
MSDLPQARRSKFSGILDAHEGEIECLRLENDRLVTENRRLREALGVSLDGTLDMQTLSPLSQLFQREECERIVPECAGDSASDCALSDVASERDTKGDAEEFSVKDIWSGQSASSKHMSWHLSREEYVQGHLVLSRVISEVRVAKMRQSIVGSTSEMRRYITRLAAAFYNSILASIPLNPNSLVRVCWDIAGLILIVYDVFAIPFTVAFDAPDVPFTIFMSWFTLLFWTWDMVMSNVTAFYKHGELMVKMRDIFKNYMKTWLIIDLLVVVPDWAMKLSSAGSGEDFAEVARLLRSLRAMRTLRLLRLLKLQKLLLMVYDLVDSEYMFILMEMMRSIAFIIVLNHVIACAWFVMGKIGMEAGDFNWLEHTGQYRVIDGSLVWKYTTAVHWSLTQFTPASMDVFARNVPERVLSIIVLFFSVLVFSSVIGQVTTLMTALRSLQGDNKKQLWLLRRFLLYKKVDSTTRTRILRYLEHRMSETRDHLKQTDIPILMMLSEPLQTLLGYELRQRLIIQHCIFVSIDANMHPIMQRVCSDVLKIIALAALDIVFSEGELARNFSFMKAGEWVYKRPRHDSQEVSTEAVSEGHWISEACMWTDWFHRGQLFAEEPGELCCIEPASFAIVMKVHPWPWNFCKNYARRFVELLSSLERDQLSDMLPDMVAESALEVAKEHLEAAHYHDDGPSDV